MYEKCYTGINDVDGKMIHEGDTIYFKIINGFGEEGEAQVYFSKGCFRLNDIHPLIDYVEHGYVKVI